MLVSLAINNVVLIDRLNIEFQRGFSALTGETGAGKSILLDSLGLALGGRSESGLVRKGAEAAQVTAEFAVGASHPLFKILHNANIEIEGDAVILRRSVGIDGRSRAFINDQPVSVSLLKQVGETLVEIHGQFETHGLLDPRTHAALLDEYANVDVTALAAAWDAWRQAERAIIDAQERARKVKAEEDYIRAALDTLEELDPKPGEEEKLAALRGRLMRRGQTIENLSTARDGIEVAQDTLNGVWRALEKADAGDLMKGLDSVLAELQEVGAQVQRLSADLEDSEYSLTEIDDRLFAIRGQARKHNVAADELPKLREDLAAQLSLIGRQEEMLDELKAKAGAARMLFVKAAEAAGAARRKAAEKLDKLVAKELPPLKLDKARFVTDVAKLPESEWGPAGQDNVRFLVATNPGAEPGPLNKIASGGEMARFMLALKVVMAETGAAGTLVFDEVDTGIGGATASAVGERLARLAQKRQILVVTHSPQVAARASHHWIVLKDGRKDVTTKVIPLAEAAARQEEIARMLSGAEITKEARAAADKLLEIRC
ncbi:MAG TPA: DNA repair protein RecN [Alphaproteobacteria bacterium]|jgi:DNA repair protein RecN (Recombination protein N)